VAVPPGIDLTALRRFLAVAEAGGVRRAADRLNLSQPALSRAIADLEAILGRPLFRRSAVGVTLTAEGARFHEAAQRAVSGFEDPLTAYLGRPAPPPPLRIIHLSGSRFAARAVAACRAAHPDMPVALHQAASSDQLAVLAAGEADIALLRAPTRPARGIEVTGLFDQDLMVALPAGDPLSAHGHVAIRHLAERDLVLPPAAMGSLHERVVALAVEAGFQVRAPNLATEMSAVLGLVAAGAGVSVVPDRPDATVPPAVVLRPLLDAAGRVPRIDFSIAWTAGDGHPMRSAFLAVCRALLAAGDPLD